MKIRKQWRARGGEVILYGSGREDFGTVTLSTKKLGVRVQALNPGILEVQTERQ